MVRFFPIAFLTMLAVSCGTGFLNPSQYLNWLNKKDNPLWAYADGNAFTYSIKYKPVAEMALNETGIQAGFASFDSIRIEYEGMEYYLLKIKSKAGAPDVIKTAIREESEYYDRLNYLSFEMQSDIALLSGADTIPCAMYHFERSYGAAPDLKILLGFPQQDPGFQHDRHVLFFSRLEPSAQLIKLDIPEEQIRKIPALKF